MLGSSIIQKYFQLHHHHHHHHPHPPPINTIPAPSPHHLLPSSPLPPPPPNTHQQTTPFLHHYHHSLLSPPHHLQPLPLYPPSQSLPRPSIGLCVGFTASLFPSLQSRNLGSEAKGRSVDIGAGGSEKAIRVGEALRI